MKSEIDLPSGKLPFELKAKIFSYLGHDDKRSIRRVCPSWRRVMDDSMRFHAFLNNKTKDWMMNWCHQPFTLSISKMTVQNENFNFEAYKMAIPRTNHFIIGIGVSESCMLSFLQNFNARMKTLELWNLGLSNISTGNLKRLQPPLKWSNLLHFEISAGSDRGIKLGSAEQQRRHYRAFVELLQVAHFPVLRTFNCFLNLESDWLDLKNKKTYMAPYQVVFDFLISHTTTLRELELAFQSDVQQPFANGQLIRKIFSKLSLTEFKTHFDSCNSDLFRFMCAGLKDLKSLKYLEYIPYRHSAEVGDPYFISEVIRFHGPTLETLVVHKLNHFNCSCLHHFEKLTFLELILLDPHYIRDAPNLATVKTFNLTAFYGPWANTPAVNVTCNGFISMIINCMPNLENLKAAFHGRGFKYTPDHVTIFANIPTLKKMNLFEVEEPKVPLFCKDTPGLTCTMVPTANDFRYCHIDINRKVYDAQFY